MSLVQEQQHLVLSAHHLQAGRRRLRRQIALIRRLRADGEDERLAVELLRALCRSQDAMRAHCQLIRAHIG